MGFTETMLLIALLLILLDFFVATDILTHAAYIIISVWVGLIIDAHIFYRILFGVLTWFSVVLFHYFVWSKLVHDFVEEYIIPDKYKSSYETLVGSFGRVRHINHAPMVEIHDSLFEYRSEHPLKENTLVRVIDYREGIVKVEPIDEE
jgi:membrane protein implicated in regulation of membrane protease activity